MWARGRFDVGWSDLAFGALHCAWPGDRDRAQHRVERLWSPDGDALACDSVRSGFDLLLRGLDLPAGSEVLFSALNVKGMIRVAERRGLLPIPVDLDLDRLAPRPDALARAISPRSRLLVVAHLFGARIDLDPVLKVARRHGLFVVEDCAQAFERVGDTGHPDANVSLFSFGPLKTATALGGALVRVSDPALLERMRRIQAHYPSRTRRSYLLRIARFAALKSLTWRWSTAALMRLPWFSRGNLDRQLEDAVRRLTRDKDPSKPGTRRQALELRPAAPMLALLARRLRGSPERTVEARSRAGRRLLQEIGGALACPGVQNPRHGFWLFPVLVKQPARVMAALRAEGFDAAPVTSLRAVGAPADRPHLEPLVARELLSHAVILPCYPAMGSLALAQQAAALRRAR